MCGVCLQPLRRRLPGRFGVIWELRSREGGEKPANLPAYSDTELASTGGRHRLDVCAYRFSLRSAPIWLRH